MYIVSKSWRKKDSVTCSRSWHVGYVRQHSCTFIPLYCK